MGRWCSGGRREGVPCASLSQTLAKPRRWRRWGRVGARCPGRGGRRALRWRSTPPASWRPREEGDTGTGRGAVAEGGRGEGGRTDAGRLPPAARPILRPLPYLLLSPPRRRGCESGVRPAPGTPGQPEEVPPAGRELDEDLCLRAGSSAPWA